MSKHIAITPADRATGEVYTMAHHLDGAWLYAERNLYVDWIEERSLS